MLRSRRDASTRGYRLRLVPCINLWALRQITNRRSVQGPVRIPFHSAPQPDLALLRPRSYRHRGARAADVLLIIEVADSSLHYDRTVKLRLYARAGIPEYWIADVNAQTLEIYRSPSGDGYSKHRRAARGESAAPLVFPDAVIPVDAIFA